MLARRSIPAALLVSALGALPCGPAAAADPADPAGGRRPPRPAPANARVEALSPALEATLAAWYEATKDVEKLEGSHTEIKSARTFATEYHRTGRFFYEAPDRGRIDLSPAAVDGVKPQPRKGGRPYAVVAGPPQTWVCDGAQIVSLDEAAREAQVIELPADQRGENIMNGPLPFLLGMPPEVIKRRFQLRFFPGAEPTGSVRAWLTDPSSRVILELLPRRQQDAANWTRAQVMLSKPDFLPVAVKLFAPGGQEETVYNFRDLKKNRPVVATIFRGNPFKPSLRGYTIVPVSGGVAGGAGPAPRAADARDLGTVPALVNMPYRMAVSTLMQRGYKANVVKGPATENRTLEGKVAQQQYKPGAKLEPGSAVGLRIYTPAVRPAGATAER